MEVTGVFKAIIFHLAPSTTRPAQPSLILQGVQGGGEVRAGQQGEGCRECRRRLHAGSVLGHRIAPNTCFRHVPRYTQHTPGNTVTRSNKVS
ncbi:hypothetical protein E2C01_061740 [Portunus trituberculatus]|uniref:Uncharacterized protein n=1 Tax=Portunus trituberculatus TaxID=210409 RepID=A0A5B7HBT6_PORTR|nr:hypothetical protein [Portunus trituberculatus]